MELPAAQAYSALRYLPGWYALVGAVVSLLILVFVSWQENKLDIATLEASRIAVHIFIGALVGSLVGVFTSENLRKILRNSKDKPHLGV